MEKGSFHPSPSQNAQAASPQASSRVQKAEEMVRKIPLPNQLPHGIDFKDLPPASLKSSTLDSLISQNEDLMARLSVTLRKSNQLEERNALLERENASFNAKLENIREQFMVLQEKDRIATERTQNLRQETSVHKGQAQKLADLYADLYVQAQAFQRRLIHLERYRARIRKAAASVQKRAKFVSETEEQLALSQKAHQHMVNSYEAKLTELKAQFDLLRSKTGDRDQIFEEKVKLENTLVYEQRQYQIRREESQTAVNHLQEENSSLRIQLKELLLAQETQRQELEALNLELPDLREQQAAKREQIESLQALWAHKQRELDQVEEKNRSLQRLNQSLSLNLNEQRKEIHTLKTDMEKEHFQAQEKIKTLLAEVQMLRRQMSEGS